MEEYGYGLFENFPAGTEENRENPEQYEIMNAHALVANSSY
jgi:hypothetical protein